MARPERAVQKKKQVIHVLPLTKANYRILGVGLLCILLGYVALGQKPWDGFLPLYVAPVLLFAGYCILIPLGILYRKKEERQPAAVGESSDSQAVQG